MSARYYYPATELNKKIQRKRDKRIKFVDRQLKRVYCPLCIMQQNVEMKFNEITKGYQCPACGHESHPKLSQITVIKSELKASNDPRSLQKAFTSKTRHSRRIERASVNIKGQQVYQSLAEANEATNIYSTAENTNWYSSG